VRGHRTSKVLTAVQLCQQSAIGVGPMAFPGAARQTGPPTNSKRFYFQNVASSLHDECARFLKCIL